MNDNFPTCNDKGLTYSKFKRLMKGLDSNLTPDEFEKIRKVIKKALADGVYAKDEKIGSITDLTVSSSIILMEELGLKSAAILALLVYRPVMHKSISL